MARRAMSRLHGNRVGAKAQAVWACTQCREWFRPTKTEPSPKQCRCGSISFQHFPSKAEAKRYGELCLLEDTGQITGLKCQHRFPLHVISTFRDTSTKIGTYVADFRYYEQSSGLLKIEDVKGNADTHMSAWKRRHCEAEYSLTITIIQRG